MKIIFTLIVIIFLALALGILFFQQTLEKDNARIDEQGVESYLSCDCGCCGKVEEYPVVCLYKSKGDNIGDIIRQDKINALSPTCAVAGCSLGTIYKYCD